MKLQIDVSKFNSQFDRNRLNSFSGPRPIRLPSELSVLRSEISNRGRTPHQEPHGRGLVDGLLALPLHPCVRMHGRKNSLASAHDLNQI